MIIKDTVDTGQMKMKKIVTNHIETHTASCVFTESPHLNAKKHQNRVRDTNTQKNLRNSQKKEKNTTEGERNRYLCIYTYVDFTHMSEAKND